MCTMYTKNEISTSRLSKVKVLQTDIQTDVTENITTLQHTKLTTKVNNKKHTFLFIDELILPRMLSTLQKIILQLLLNVALNISHKQRPPNPARYIDQLCLHFAHVSSASIYSFSLIAQHTLSVTLKYKDWAGQVIPEILFLIFHSHEKLQLCADACQFFTKSFATKYHKFESIVCTYFWESIFPSTAAKIFPL